MDAIYLTEIMKTNCMKTLDEYWVEGHTSLSDDFNFWTECLFQYYNELPLDEAIESDYIVWKSEQHRMTPKYNILC